MALDRGVRIKLIKGYGAKLYSRTAELIATVPNIHQMFPFDIAWKSFLFLISPDSSLPCGGFNGAILCSEGIGILLRCTFFLLFRRGRFLHEAFACCCNRGTQRYLGIG
jgi:hypothetical protein